MFNKSLIIKTAIILLAATSAIGLGSEAAKSNVDSHSRKFISETFEDSPYSFTIQRRLVNTMSDNIGSTLRLGVLLGFILGGFSYWLLKFDFNKKIEKQEVKVLSPTVEVQGDLKDQLAELIIKADEAINYSSTTK